MSSAVPGNRFFHRKAVQFKHQIICVYTSGTALSMPVLLSGFYYKRLIIFIEQIRIISNAYLLFPVKNLSVHLFENGNKLRQKGFSLFKYQLPSPYQFFIIHIQQLPVKGTVFKKDFSKAFR